MGPNGSIRINNPTELFEFLRQHPQFVTGIIFILMQDQIPLYAIQPVGPFAPQTDTAMLEAAEASLDEIYNREYASRSQALLPDRRACSTA